MFKNELNKLSCVNLIFAHAKTKLHICSTVTTQLIRAFVFAAIPLLPKSEISCLLPSHMVVQPGICLTWSETPYTGFNMTQLLFTVLHSMII